MPVTIPAHAIQVNGVPTEPLVMDGLPLPHALNFQALYNNYSKVYSFRWDEAMRDNRNNALAMRRDVFIRSLLQERILPTANLPWALEVDEPNDPAQKWVLDYLTKCLRSGFRMQRLRRNLLEAIWYGRYAVQVQWAKQNGMWVVVDHAPLNGDKIQYQWDGTPCVMVNGQEAQRLKQIWGQQSVVLSDANGPLFRLSHPAARGRFVIHQHDVDDADYFEGEMAGSRWGVGLRSYFYWAWWLRQQMLDWAISFMQAVGTTQLAIVNFAQGNAAAEAEARAIAKQLSGKIVIVMPRLPTEKFQVVEIVTVDTKGIDTLQSIIENYFERRMERMAVGQSMSSGADSESGLGGTGRANFAKDTKFQIIDWDQGNLAETLSRDLVEVSKRLNAPFAQFPVRLIHSVPDPEADMKLDQAQKLVNMGIPIDAGDLRNRTGFAKPEVGAEVVGGLNPAAAALSGVGTVTQQPGQKPMAPEDVEAGTKKTKYRKSDLLQYFDESDHPRDKNGKFIDKGEIEEAKTDPKKRDELRGRVRDSDAEKLEGMFDGNTTGQGELSEDEQIGKEIADAEKAAPRANLKLIRDGQGLAKPFYKGEVSGLMVSTNVPNADSIEGTFDDSTSTVLPGIREVPIDMFDVKPYTAADDNRKSERLAEAIKESGKIKPLIVVTDSESRKGKKWWCLEGNHRLIALKKLGVKTIPAMVVVDHTEK